jgi:hypothetical protein
MREQPENGYNLATLKLELDSIPKELDGLFEHILKSLSESDLKKAYQAFAILLKLKSYELQISLFSYSFLEELESDPRFAMQQSFLDSGIDNATRKNRIDSARKRLNGCCKGLVEATQEASEGPIVAFTHSSIPEFLLSRRIKSDMNYHLEGFNFKAAISQVFLAKMWFAERGSISKMRLSLIAYSLIHMRDESKIGQAPYSFLECLSSAVVKHGETNLKEDDDLFDIGFNEPRVWRVIGCTGRNGQKDYTISSPLYLSAWHKNYEYATWKVEHDPTAIDSPLKMALLVHCIRPSLSGLNQALSVLDLLLGRGLSPQTFTNIWNPSIKNKKNKENVYMSIWQHFILWCVQCHQTGDGTKFRTWSRPALLYFDNQKPYTLG